MGNKGVKTLSGKQTRDPRKKSPLSIEKQETIVNEVVGSIENVINDDKSESDREKNFEMFIMLRDRQVKKVPVLARALGVSRPTVYGYIDRYEKVLRQSAFDRAFDVERENEYSAITNLINEMRQEIKELSGRAKIASLRDIAMLMKQRGELYGVYQGGMSNLDNKKISDVPPDEISNIEGAIESIEKILAGANSPSIGKDADDGGV